MPTKSERDRHQALLEVRNLHAGYEEADILHGVNLRVNPGEVVCIIGPNGAGKSTLVKVLCGLLEPRSGEVRFDGRAVTGSRPQDLLGDGITTVLQSRGVFPQMTVQENLELGMYLERDMRLVKKRISEVLELFPQLVKCTRQQAGIMSGGEQRMLEIARALMPEPRLMLIDEPSAGLAPKVARTILGSLLQLNQIAGLSVLLVEQNARQALQISHRGYVLDLGRNSFEGSGEALLANPDVRRAFLGGNGNGQPVGSWRRLGGLAGGPQSEEDQADGASLIVPPTLPYPSASARHPGEPTTTRPL